MDASHRSVAKKRLICAYTVLATLPGIPTVFYGDEAGLEGFGDPFNRMPYPWGREDLEILNHYKLLGSIRTEHAIYKNGDFKLIYLDKNLLLFKRFNGTNTYLTVLNNSENDFSIKFDTCAKALIKKRSSDTHFISSLSAEIFYIKNNSSIEIFEG